MRSAARIAFHEPVERAAFAVLVERVDEHLRVQRRAHQRARALLLLERLLEPDIVVHGSAMRLPRPTLAISATATRLTTSELPPNEMNGSGTPVTGHDDVTTPMLMKA